jgi:predicted metal-dependent HD superfamily phosphohydrolase
MCAMDVVSVEVVTRALLDAGWPHPSALSLLVSLAESYNTPPRAYHNLRHLEELLGWFAEVRDNGPGWVHPNDVLAAILFHDAVYVAGRADNEKRSADLAREHIARHGLPCDPGRVTTLIEATASHGEGDGSPSDPARADLVHFLDADMAILGAPADRFDDYERAIAAEYAAVPPELFRAGRGRFVERLLALPRLYQTEFFSSRLESAARANLTRASAALND